VIEVLFKQKLRLLNEARFNLKKASAQAGALRKAIFDANGKLSFAKYAKEVARAGNLMESFKLIAKLTRRRLLI
jgi:hypothetical protein